MTHKAHHVAIAIDGPAASGKTTVGRILAEKLGFLYLDTGSMYRAVTFAALEQGLAINDEPAIVDLTCQLELEIESAEGITDGRHYTVFLNGRDVTWQIRSPIVDVSVSLVSSFQGVRKNLVERQRQIGKRDRVVMVGRDIGTVVLPDAPLKIYLTASAEERARRRWRERLQNGEVSDYEDCLAEIKRRDEFDGTREHSPLRPANDAIIIDSTNLTTEEIIDKILSLPFFRQSEKIDQ